MRSRWPQQGPKDRTASVSSFDARVTGPRSWAAMPHPTPGRPTCSFGACAGADLAVEAIALTAFVLAGNTLLRPLVNAINRAPINAETTEAQYEVRVTADVDHLENTRDERQTRCKR